MSLWCRFETVVPEVTAEAFRVMMHVHTQGSASRASREWPRRVETVTKMAERGFPLRALPRKLEGTARQAQRSAPAGCPASLDGRSAEFVRVRRAVGSRPVIRIPHRHRVAVEGSALARPSTGLCLSTARVERINGSRCFFRRPRSLSQHHSRIARSAAPRTQNPNHSDSVTGPPAVRRQSVFRLLMPTSGLASCTHP